MTVSRKSAEDRREELVRAAIALVARKGFAAVTLRDVAAEVGVAHGLIRHYFPSREALLAAAFDRAVRDELAQLPPTVDDPLVALADWCTSSVEVHYLVWIDAWAEAPRDPELATALRAHHLALDQHTAGLLRRACAAGGGRCDDPDDAARQLTAMLDGLAVQLHVLRVLTPDEHDRVALAHAERLLALRPGTLARAVSSG
ncbi:TetR family transcriptional regulator [Actinotalea ferrariae CF5-4]|uniref:TetR family transcriptional regulator n=1 Tax=Actinotalea ferrariae CF5-4 TaxID=948458 RepID=A0A021VUS1_9CELL|nr:TetR family transcriptional regulator C-terminal domain-containing protein [Actinotalea ferrariae]EYR62832.1 TetR family transcriptional regulator [Actinotalea ferrariae CF5-4]